MTSMYRKSAQALLEISDDVPSYMTQGSKHVILLYRGPDQLDYETVIALFVVGKKGVKLVNDIMSDRNIAILNLRHEYEALAELCKWKLKNPDQKVKIIDKTKNWMNLINRIKSGRMR